MNVLTVQTCLRRGLQRRESRSATNTPKSRRERKRLPGQPGWSDHRSYPRVIVGCLATHEEFVQWQLAELDVEVELYVLCLDKPIYPWFLPSIVDPLQKPTILDCCRIALPLVQSDLFVLQSDVLGVLDLAHMYYRLLCENTSLVVLFTNELEIPALTSLPHLSRRSSTILLPPHVRRWSSATGRSNAARPPVQLASPPLQETRRQKFVVRTHGKFMLNAENHCPEELALQMHLGPNEQLVSFPGVVLFEQQLLRRMLLGVAKDPVPELSREDVEALGLQVDPTPDPKASGFEVDFTSLDFVTGVLPTLLSLQGTRFFPKSLEQCDVYSDILNISESPYLESCSDVHRILPLFQPRSRFCGRIVSDADLFHVAISAATPNVLADNPYEASSPYPSANLLPPLLESPFRVPGLYHSLLPVSLCSPLLLLESVICRPLFYRGQEVDLGNAPPTSPQEREARRTDVHEDTPKVICSFLEPGVSLGADVQLTGCYVGANATIGDGSILVACVVDSGAIVNSHTEASEDRLIKR
ncbi:MAG: uncharacterized protein KVP18_000959 [Porospora cf. gigantea A]|nr:MAG: hypothetical protein KVP18_000959 [Porospora cf. gigantea A]